MEAEGEAGGRRPPGHVDGHDGDDEAHHVGDHVARVGDDGQTMGEEAADQLRDDEHRRQEGDEGEHQFGASTTGARK